MTVQALPDNPDYVFCPEELPGDGMYRIVITVDGLDKVIPTTLIALTLKCCAQHFSVYVAVVGMLRDSRISRCVRHLGCCSATYLLRRILRRNFGSDSE